MEDFKKINTADRDTLEAFLGRKDFPVCTYSAGNAAFVDREQVMSVEGLCQPKQSDCPAFLADKGGLISKAEDTQ